MRKVLIIILIAVALIGIIVFGYFYAFPNLSSENRAINSWIKENNLNQYGDASNTVYSNGKPCSTTLTCFDYIKKMHPEKPWSK